MPDPNRMQEFWERVQTYLYCNKCEEMTPHVEVADEIFVRGLLCLNCGMVWEAELPPSEIN